MIRIVANHNKQDITHTFTTGQTFPEVQGKLLSVEISGKELSRLLEKKEIPICSVDSSSLTWHGKPAGSILKLLRELYQ